MKKFLGNFTLNLGKVCRKSVEFQNKFPEPSKVKILELENLDQVKITVIDILKKFSEKRDKILQKIWRWPQKLKKKLS